MPRARSSRTLCGELVSKLDARDAQLAQHGRRNGVAAFIGAESQVPVGIHGVEPGILQLIGAQLVGKADAAALLRQIQQHAAAGLVQSLHRRLQLLAAIAAQAAQQVAGEAR